VGVGAGVAVGSKVGIGVAVDAGDDEQRARDIETTVTRISRAKTFLNIVWA
jgi:hypothetical protein